MPCRQAGQVVRILTALRSRCAHRAFLTFRTFSSFLKRTCVAMSGRETANVPASPQHDSVNSTELPSEGLMMSLTTLTGEGAARGVWQGSWYM